MTTKPVKKVKRMIIDQTEKDRLLGYLKKAIHTKGRQSMIKYLKGELIGRPDAMLAKCCECMAYHADGMLDCQVPTCPLYPWMPYRKK